MYRKLQAVIHRFSSIFSRKLFYLQKTESGWSQKTEFLIHGDLMYFQMKRPKFISTEPFTNQNLQKNLLVISSA